ncbi:MAG TPA: response regulator [Verrucomicrobiae bacterium]|nr:response regulator [Verrucomicrobiae bacterium]
MTRVLVLDDDVTVADLIRIVLEDAGYDVAASHSASELPDGPFACVVTDLMTIVLYDTEAAREYLLRLGERYPQVPLIVVTGHGGALRDKDRLGVRRVIVKPFDVDRLVRAVGEAITS